MSQKMGRLFMLKMAWNCLVLAIVGLPKKLPSDGRIAWYATTGHAVVNSKGVVRWHT